MPNAKAPTAGRIARWLERTRKAREHRALLTLPDYLLRDIGLTRADLNRAIGSSRG